MLVVQTGTATSVGRVRKVNEDSLLAETQLFVIADGMGGHAAGDVASQLAVERLRGLAGTAGLHAEDVLIALQQANAEILQSADLHVEQTGMGTTVTGLGVVLVGGSDHWVVFNVGDSRVYRFADDQLAQLTVDHSEVEELLAAGRITAEEADHHPNRNVVTRSLGTLPAPTPDVWVFPPAPEERFLLCSDGLPRELSDQQIEMVLRASRDPQEAADRLVQEAVDAGGSDNVTVVVVDLPRSSQIGFDGPSQDTAPRLVQGQGV